MIEQVINLSDVEPSNIAHGVLLDPEFVMRATDGGCSPLYPGEGPVALRGGILNLGSGAGHRSIRLWKELGYDPINFDVNETALREERAVHGVKLPLFHCDLANWGKDIALVASALLESVPMVYMGALLENMMADWPRALEIASYTLLPGGTAIIGGVALPKHYNPLFVSTLGKDFFRQYKDSWERRMRAAQHFNSQRYAFGMFPVLKPGVLKNLEWGSLEDLRLAVSQGGYERDAQHMDLDKVLSYASQLGLSIHNFEWRVWKSRTGQPLSGYMLALRKGPTYDYVHGLVGRTIMEARQTRVRVDGPRALGQTRREFFEGKIATLEASCHDKGIEPPSVLVRLWAQFATEDFSELDRPYDLFTNVVEE